MSSSLAPIITSSIDIWYTNIVPTTIACVHLVYEEQGVSFCLIQTTFWYWARHGQRSIGKWKVRIFDCTYSRCGYCRCTILVTARKGCCRRMGTGSAWQCYRLQLLLWKSQELLERRWSGNALLVELWLYESGCRSEVRVLRRHTFGGSYVNWNRTRSLFWISNHQLNLCSEFRWMRGGRGLFDTLFETTVRLEGLFMPQKCA